MEISMNVAETVNPVDATTDSVTPDAPVAEYDYTVDLDKYTGLAKDIQFDINRLAAARDMLVKLESGLTTKADLGRSSKFAREHIIGVRKSLSKLCGSILDKKKGLFGTISETQKAAKIIRLEEQAKKVARELAELKKDEA